MLCIHLVKSLQKAFFKDLKTRGFLFVQRVTLAARQRPVASLLYKTLTKHTLEQSENIFYTEKSL